MGGGLAAEPPIEKYGNQEGSGAITPVYGSSLVPTAIFMTDCAFRPGSLARSFLPTTWYKIFVAKFLDFCYCEMCDS